MCFSATASFLASGSIGAVGIAGAKGIRRRRDLAVAFIPLVFAIQQAFEGVVWLSLNQPTLNFLVSKAFLFFAYAFWPAFIPWAVRLAEPSKKRRNILLLFVVVGMLVGLYGLWLVFFLPSHTIVIKQSLQYHIPESYLAFGLVYAAVVCGSCLLSTSKWIIAMGALLSMSLLVALFFSYEAVASVWCFYAAFLSVLVYFHLRSSRPSIGYS